MAPMSLLVANVSFRRAQADPRPEGAGFAIVSGEVDLDREKSGRWVCVEDRRRI